MTDVINGGEQMSGPDFLGHIEYLTGEGRRVPWEFCAEIGLDESEAHKLGRLGCSGPIAAYARLAVRLKRAGLPWRHNEVPIHLGPAGIEIGRPGDMVFRD